MSRNRIKIEQRTRYNDITGRPYKHWIATCMLGAGGWVGSTGRLERKDAVRELKGKLSEIARSVALALAKLDKE